MPEPTVDSSEAAAPEQTGPAGSHVGGACASADPAPDLCGSGAPSPNSAPAAPEEEGPVCLVVQNGPELQLHPDGERLLRSLGRTPIAVIAVAGLYRTGKSFLLNQVRSYFLVFVPTIREIPDFYREMQRTNRESVTIYSLPWLSTSLTTQQHQEPPGQIRRASASAMILNHAHVASGYAWSTPVFGSVRPRRVRLAPQTPPVNHRQRGKRCYFLVLCPLFENNTGLLSRDATH
eukprot:SAG31_NODE_2532_length_5555_cov_2.362170_1_plen_234_part_00